MIEITIESMQDYLSKSTKVDTSQGQFLLANDVARYIQEHNKPLRMEVFASVLCESGGVEGRVNGKTLALKARDVLFLIPGTVLNPISVEEGSVLYMTAIAPTSMIRSVFVDKAVWNQYIYLSQNPVLHLPESSYEVIYNFFRLSLSLQQGEKMPFNKKVNQNILEATIYQFLNYCSVSSGANQAAEAHTQAENIFLKFLRLSSEAKGSIRSVAEAADKVCVSPKYLSKVVKEVSGATPIQWLHEITVKQIALELSTTMKSVKEIAMELGFSNLSAFGSFVRKSLNASPRQYRAEHSI